MPPKKSNRGTHPNSLQNLEKRGRTTVYDEPKSGHEISTTPTAWAGLRTIAAALGYGRNISELAEQIGRENLTVLQLPAQAIEVLRQMSDDRAYITAALLEKLKADGYLE